jgi:predicted DNA-binding protein (MmcQ/YjbR family)
LKFKAFSKYLYFSTRFNQKHINEIINIEELRDYCHSLKGTTGYFPFNEVTLLMKVLDKMFALIPLDNPETQISLKCDPERAIALREE